MEVVGAGASVLAFIGIALQSAKFIHDVFSAVKDGPENVKRAAYYVEQLQLTLERLSRCRAIDSDVATRDQVSKCTSDMETIAQKLQKLAVSETEKRSGRLWKRLRAAYSDNDLAKISVVVRDHTSALHISLSVLQSEAVHSSRDKLVDMECRMVQEREIGATRWQAQQAAFAGINTNLDHLRNDYSSIKDALTSMPMASFGQADQMIDILRQLQSQLNRLTVPNPEPRVEILPEDNSSLEMEHEEARLKVDDETSRSIDLLCDLIYLKQGTVGSEEAEDIITALQKLLQYLRTAEDMSSLQSSQESRQLVRDLKAVEGLALSAERISLNEPEQRQGRLLGTAVQTASQRHQFIVGSGTLTLLRKRRKRRNSSQTEEDFGATVTFLPTDGQRCMFAVSVQNQRLPTGIFATIPRFSANNVLPAKSTVFRLVLEGRLREFKEMLQDGRASLRDHDQYGASLLFYSISQPEMCKFLLDSGIDVDHYASIEGPGRAGLGHGYTSNWAGSALSFGNLDYDMSDKQLQKINQCRRLILDAGYDPLLQSSANSGPVPSPFFEALRFSSAETMKLFLDSCPFIDLEVREYELTPLLYLCLCGQGNITPNNRKIELLLRRGADPHVTDADGNGCLHLVLRSSGDYDLDDYTDIQKSLILLVQSGADVRARTDTGMSVSELAYDHNSISIGEIWDCVLATCGYNVSEFRHGHPWRYESGSNLPRSMFKKIWQGIEHLCPYYNDEAVASEADRDENNDAEDDEDCDEDDVQDVVSEARWNDGEGNRPCVWEYGVGSIETDEEDDLPANQEPRVAHVPLGTSPLFENPWE